MLDVGAVTDSIVGFHAQQAVEKSLKAVLAVKGVDFPFTHDIEGLVELCEAEGAALPAHMWAESIIACAG
jgi:HEPN domain-containing protein